MEIDKAMERLRHSSSGVTRPQTSSQGYLQETIRKRYGDESQFINRFTISHEATYCKHTWRCILGTAPTMAQVNVAYGAHTSAAWLVPFLWDISEFCGCKQKFTSKQMDELAYIIVDGYYWLKVTEMMLFFWWFKSGRYGKFYGSVDPMVITTALREFVKDRNAIIAKHDGMEAEKKHAEWKRRAITYEEYKARHAHEEIRT